MTYSGPLPYIYKLLYIHSWSPYTLYSSFESKNLLNEIHAAINKGDVY